jgi:hypothetical protein
MITRPRWTVFLLLLSILPAALFVPQARAQALHRLGDVTWIALTGPTFMNPVGEDRGHRGMAIEEGPVVPQLGIRVGVGAFVHSSRFLSFRFLTSYEIRRARRELSGTFAEFWCLCNVQETQTERMRMDFVVASVVGRFHPLGERSGPFLGAGPSFAIPTHSDDRVEVRSSLLNFTRSYLWDQQPIAYETVLEAGYAFRSGDLAIEPTASWTFGVVRLGGPLWNAKSGVLGLTLAVHR